ncbi:hypothetical protein RRF57_000671 [Xylaria bambusicola]|uniref:Uncharacterized protein n=1 Tax=Xylaria bambusicola TaxID=326684 RepID=A0AAN7U485_9PEZI
MKIFLQWRDAVLASLVYSPWDYKGTLQSNVDAESYLIDVAVLALKVVALNEANRRQADLKEGSYGTNYDRLLSMTRVYDLEDLFYAAMTMRFDAGVPGGSGRLCRSQA